MYVYWRKSYNFVFREMDLLADRIRIVLAKHWNIMKLTDVQVRCLQAVLSNSSDVIVQAPTGSGKTLAYLLPSLQLMSRRKAKWKRWEIGLLVLVPSRELASQVEQVAKPLAKEFGLTTLLLIGGIKIKRDLAKFKLGGANVVIGTPGKLAKLMGATASNDDHLRGHLKSLEMLVVDEADRFVEAGFRNSMSSILSAVPKQRRSGLFSATQCEEMEDILLFGLRNPCVIVATETAVLDVNSSADGSAPAIENLASTMLPKKLSLFYAVVPADSKTAALSGFLKKHKRKKILIFFSSGACVDYFYDWLTCANSTGGNKNMAEKPSEEGRPSKRTILAIHGGKKGSRRARVVEQFRKHRNSVVLLATDVMSRGIDVSDIDWVVQFDLPKLSSWFVHRSGRAARFGQRGNTLLLLTKEEDAYVDYMKRVSDGIRFCRLELEIDDADGVMAALRKKAAEDSEFREKGTRAFVSFVQAFTKRDTKLLCGLKDYDLVGTALSYGLLRLPKMVELKGRYFAASERFGAISGAVTHNNKRKNPLNVAEESSKYTYRQIDGAERKAGKCRHGEDEFADDIRLMKRLKAGKISKQEFDERFLDF